MVVSNKIMRIGRTLPPAAAPIPLIDIIRALPDCFYHNSQDNNFKQEIKRDFNIKHCFLLSSGKAALTIILLALKKKYPDRNQVIIPAFTCYSVPAAIKRAGLQISLCDLAPSSLNFDKGMLRRIIAEDKQKTKILCILPTHLFGCPANIDGIRTIVGPELPIIEDAAQAMGETVNSKKLGTLGDIGFFSLGRGKALSTTEGGVIVTDRDDLANIVKQLTVSLTEYDEPGNLLEVLKTILTTILQNPSLFWLPKALPFLKLGETLYEPDFSLSQLTAFHTALAKNWQKRLGRHQRARNRNVTYWQKVLPEIFIQPCCLTDINMIRLPILVQTREQKDCILRESERHGLGMMAAYPTPINRIPELANEFVGQTYAQAEISCSCILTIPVHEYVRNKDNERIYSLLTDFMEDLFSRVPLSEQFL